MILFHKALTVADARQAAESIGCRLIQDRQGNVIITPRHTNADVVKFPQRRGQFGASQPPTGPEAA